MTTRRFSLVLLAVLLCKNISPLESGGVTDTVMANPFDGGAVNSCVESAAARQGICKIDYPVPAGLASLVQQLEDRITVMVERHDGLLSFQYSDECRSTYREALCAFHFPRCEGANVIMRSSVNCSRLYDSQVCGASVIGNGVNITKLCDLHATVELDSCRELSTYDEFSSFRHCGPSTTSSSSKVTAWMFEYMKLTDLELQVRLAPTSVLGNYPNCSPLAAKYYCQFYGHCNAKGDRIAVNITEDFCQTIPECYTDNIQNDILRLNCPLWPLESERPVSGVPSPTSMIDKTAVTDKQSSSSSHNPWPLGNHYQLPTSRGFNKVCSLVFLLLFVALSLTVLR